MVNENGKRVRKAIRPVEIIDDKRQMRGVCWQIADKMDIRFDEVEVEMVDREGDFIRFIQNCNIKTLEEFKEGAVKMLRTKVLVNDEFPYGALVQRVYRKGDDNTHYELVPLKGNCIDVSNAKIVDSTDMQGELFNAWKYECK